MHLTMESLEDLILEKHDLNRDEITREATLDEDLGIDSLDVTELVMDAESNYKIVVKDEAAKVKQGEMFKEGQESEPEVK